MTTGENIDSVNPENITLTSDEAFERVTNDIKMEDGGREGYLKQNTSGLVQEIPNISFLDIADTMLESKKTFHGKQNWVLRVGVNAKSVETQPQDIGIFRDVVNELHTGLGYPNFNSYIKGSNNICFGSSQLPGVGAYEIREKGIYSVSYSFTLQDISSIATLIGWYIMKQTSGGTISAINNQSYGNGNGGNPIGISTYSASGSTHLELDVGDKILLAIKVTDTNGDGVGRGITQAEFTLQFQQYKL